MKRKIPNAKDLVVTVATCDGKKMKSFNYKWEKKETLKKMSLVNI